MIELSRAVRFSVPLDPAADQHPDGRNTFAGWPAMVGLGAWYELVVTCRGEPDAATGYLVNIKAIDAAVRRHALPIVRDAIGHAPGREPALLLPAILESVDAALGGIVSSIRWRLSPYHSVAMTVETAERYLLTERFEFAAAHRLHCPELSAAENQRIFGKCNNPSGHGHNYQIDVAVAVPMPAGDGPPAFRTIDLERVVDETIITRFDHKNLDVDTEEFAECNSSVERIAQVCYELLQRPLADAGADLKRVVVWETEKTSCAYPA